MNQHRSALSLLAATAMAVLLVGCGPTDDGAQDSGATPTAHDSAAGANGAKKGAGGTDGGNSNAQKVAPAAGSTSTGGSQASAVPQDGAHDDHMHGPGSLCEEPPVDVRLTGYQSADGHNSLYVVLKNEGNHPCHTQGFLGLQLDKGGSKTSVRMARGLQSPDEAAQAVELASFDTAWAQLKWEGGVACDTNKVAPDQVELTLPDSFHQTKLKWDYDTVCADQPVHVGPLHAGSPPAN